MAPTNEAKLRIGTVFDSPDLDRLQAVLAPAGLTFGAEGSRIAGYSIYASETEAAQIVSILPKHNSTEPGSLRFFVRDPTAFDNDRQSEAEQSRWLAWRQECFEKEG
jgi:hypothetical protein